MIYSISFEEVELLRSTVERSGHFLDFLVHGLALCQRQLAIVLLGAAAAKITDLPSIVRRFQDILNLQVSMRHLVVVKVSQPISNVIDDLHELSLVGDASEPLLALVLDQVKQRPTRAILKQHVHLKAIVLLILLPIDELDEVLAACARAPLLR